MSLLDVFNKQTIEVKHETYKSLFDEFGVDISVNGNDFVFTCRDKMAGLTESEITQYNHIQSTSDAEKYKANILSNRYPDNYLQFTADSEDKQKVFDELSFVEKVKDPGYLNSLSSDDLQNLCENYIQYAATHKQGVYGHTDAELSDMSDADRFLVDEHNKSYTTEWESLKMDSEPTKQNDKESVSMWGKLKNNVSMTFNAIGNWFASTEVGEWVIDKYNDLFDKEEKQSEQVVSDEKTNAKSEREDPAANIDYSGSSGETEYGD